MRKSFSETVEDARLIGNGPWATRRGDRFGFFKFQRPGQTTLAVMVYGGEDDGWEHVSVSTRKRTPTWDEMAWVKHLFWGPEERAVQFHPPASEYVDQHPHCLHMWGWLHGEFPHPDPLTVGIVRPKDPK